MSSQMTNLQTEAKDNKMSWWRDAKFGMFIHWGLYAVTEGEWKGKEVPGIGEWVMKRFQIPIKEYEPLASQFNPVKFNAKEWVDIAKNAGMKYIVITAKHHDGFCMYHSKVSKYNIVDATPFGRDPMKELAEACKEAGLKLCFYYSQTQDWYEKDAVGNTWDFPKEEEKDFQKYIDEKVKPQVKELLTQYGPIGLIWFDTPLTMTDSQSKDLEAFVTSIQPECIVNGRVGNGFGDYVCLGDNETPASSLHVDWETCATLNHTWGFKKNDHHWKSPEVIIRLLSDIIGKGGTYLLNVGPTAEGVIPEPSANVLREVGRWLEVNEEAIRGTTANRFESEFEWGTITLKPGKVFLHLFDWPGSSLTLYGLKNKVIKAYLLASPDQGLSFEQSYDEATQNNALKVSLPAQSPGLYTTILALNIEGNADVDTSLMQQADGKVILSGHQALIHKTSDSEIALSRSGVITNWSDTNDRLSWDFKVSQPGRFKVQVISMSEKARDALGEQIGRWEGGHVLLIETAGQRLTGVIKEQERIVNSRSLYFNRIRSELGEISIDHGGNYNLQIKPLNLNFEQELGLKLISVNLIPV